jgi:hypothetical protein
MQNYTDNSLDNLNNQTIMLLIIPHIQSASLNQPLYIKHIHVTLY